MADEPQLFSFRRVSNALTHMFDTEGMTMTDILLIADEFEAHRDHELVDEAAMLHPDRVMVVIPGDNSGWENDSSREGESRRNRMMYLLARIADRTGAAVMGTVTEPSLADHGGYAAVVSSRVAAAA